MEHVFNGILWLGGKSEQEGVKLGYCHLSLVSSSVRLTVRNTPPPRTQVLIDN